MFTQVAQLGNLDANGRFENPAFVDPGVALQKYVFVTGNPGKLYEVQRICSVVSSTINLNVPEVQPTSADHAALERGDYESVMGRIAAAKAIAAYEIGKFKLGIVVEDVGFFISAKHGRPGPLVATYCDDRSLEDFCHDAARRQDDRAVWITAVATYNGQGEPQVRFGRVEGLIPPSPRGENGFGFDSIFIPSPETQAKQLGTPSAALKTLAEMTAPEKDLFSARRLAWEALEARPFLSPATPKAPELSASLFSDFKRHMKTAVSDEARAQVEDVQTGRIRKWHEELRRGQGAADTIERLTQTGELPIETPYDTARGTAVPLPDDIIVPILASRHFDIEDQTHPARLESQLALQKRGYIPIASKSIPVFDELIGRELNTFDDFSLKPRAAKVTQQMDESTLAIHASGLMTWTSTKMVTSITNGGSMHATIGAFSMATLGLLGAMSFAPADSKWRDVQAQLRMIERARELVRTDPVITEHSYKDHVLSNGQTLPEFLIARADRCIGATIKPDDKAVENAKLLYQNGVRLFRIYDPGATNKLVETVAALRAALGDEAILLAGQVLDDGNCSSVEQAFALEAAGADGLIVGIGDGEMCSTSTTADISGDNPKVGYQIVRAGVKLPLIFDGGVGGKNGVATAIGAAGRLSSRGLIGGTIEQPSLLWYPPADEAGKFLKNYGGEAGKATKWGGRMLDRQGRPFNVEGIEGAVSLNFEAGSVAYRMFLFHQAFAKSLRFQRLLSAESLQHLPVPPIRKLSTKAAETAAPHHR